MTLDTTVWLIIFVLFILVAYCLKSLMDILEIQGKQIELIMECMEKQDERTDILHNEIMEVKNNGKGNS